MNLTYVSVSFSLEEVAMQLLTGMTLLFLCVSGDHLALTR